MYTVFVFFWVMISNSFEVKIILLYKISDWSLSVTYLRVIRLDFAINDKCIEFNVPCEIRIFNLLYFHYCRFHCLVNIKKSLTGTWQTLDRLRVCISTRIKVRSILSQRILNFPFIGSSLEKYGDHNATHDKLLLISWHLSVSISCRTTHTQRPQSTETFPACLNLTHFW